MLASFCQLKCYNKVIKTTFMPIRQSNREIEFCYILIILERDRNFTKNM